MSSEGVQIKQEIEEIDVTTSDNELTMMERILSAMQRRDEEAKHERQAIREEIGAMRQSMLDVWMAESARDPNIGQADVKTEIMDTPESVEEDKVTI